jgi:hypothetical protein
VSHSDTNHDISRVLITLMRGATYQEDNPALWQSLLNLQARVREYAGLVGLEMILDEAEGYAYLRQRASMDGDQQDVPRLVPRRQLSYPVSLLLALLRKRLAECDAMSGDTRLILSRDDIVDIVRVFLPDTANEARLMDRIDGYINKVLELGFLRKLRGQEDRFEVRRILKAFIDAQWLKEFDQRLAEYRDHAAGLQPGVEESGIERA